VLILLIASLALAGTALALAGRAVVFPRMRASEAVGRIAAYGYDGVVAATPETERGSLVARLAGFLGSRLSRSSSEEQLFELRQVLQAAGAWNTTPATLAGYRAISAIVFGAAMAWLARNAGLPGIVAVGGGVYMGFLGWRVPLIVLKARARQRLERIELELPELIDLLVVTLEAGLAFNAALHRSAERMRGPLGAELRMTLQEQSLGLSLQGALANLLGRCDVPAVRAFVRAVSQGEAMGISIGQVMRELAGDLRTRRRQIVEEKAQKAPIKILFPLAALILPATVIIVLFPGLYNIIHKLSQGV
jgi:tight adherence protein C